MDNKTNNLYEFGSFRMDTKERVLFQDKEAIFLAPKVFDTLEFLVERNGKVVSKNELLDEVWADSFVEESNLTQNIYVLRKTLGKEFIETVPRRGYRFSSEVKILENGNGNSYASNESDEILIAKRTKTSAYLKEEVFEEDTETESVPAEKTEKSFFRFGKLQIGIVAGLLIAVLVGALGLLLWQRNFSASNDSILENVKLDNLTDTGNVQNFVISPDGQFLAFIRKDKTENDSIWIKDISTKKAIPIDLPKRFKPQSLDFSPDGKFIYFLHRPINSRGAEIYKTTRFGGDSDIVADDVWSQISVSPNGEEIAFYRFDREENQAQLIFYNVEEKSEKAVLTKEFPESFDRRSFPAWSADAKKIYSIIKSQVRGISKLAEIDVQTGKEKVIKTPKIRQFMSVVALPNGEDLIFTARERRKFPQIYKMKTMGGEFKRLTNDLNFYRKLSLSKDGKKLTALQKNAFSHIWFLPEASPEKAIQLTSGKNSRHGKQGIDILPDGRITFTSLDDFNRDIWTVNPKDKSKQQFTKQSNGINERPLVSNDGNYIYYNSAQGKTNDIKRIGISSGQIENIIETKTGNEIFPNTSPDGQTLYFIRRSKGKSAIYKRSLADGKETEIKTPKDFIIDSFLTVSPDGRFLAFRQADKQKRYEIAETETSPVEIGIISLEDDDFEPKTITVKTSQSQFRWSKTSDAIYFIKHTPKTSEIWKQEVFADVEPKKVIELEDTRIFHFKFADTGDLAISRGNHLDDVVLLTNFN